MRILRKKVAACTDAMQLMKLVEEHKQRFSDSEGKPYDWVHDLHDFAREQRYNILTAVNKDVEKRHAETKARNADERDFGHDYTEYKGRGQEAVDFIAKNGAGQVRGAFNRKDTGDIDVVWGKVTDAKAHKGYGIAHLIDKHGKDALKHVGEVIEKGKIIMSGERHINIEKDGYVVGIRKGWEGKRKVWIVTGFKRTDGSSSSPSATTNYTEATSPQPSNASIAQGGKKSSGKDIELGYNTFVKGDTLFERHGNEDPDDVTIPLWRDYNRGDLVRKADYYFKDNIAYKLLDDSNDRTNKAAGEMVKRDILNIENSIRIEAGEAFKILNNASAYSSNQVQAARDNLKAIIRARLADITENDSNSKYTQKPEVMDSASFNRYMKSQYPDEKECLKHIMYRCIHDAHNNPRRKKEVTKTTSQMLDEYLNDKSNPSFKYDKGGTYYGRGTYFANLFPSERYGESLFRSTWKKDARLLVVGKARGDQLGELLYDVTQEGTAAREIADIIISGDVDDPQSTFARLAGYDGMVNASFSVVLNRSATIVDNSMWQEKEKVVIITREESEKEEGQEFGVGNGSGTIRRSRRMLSPYTIHVYKRIRGNSLKDKAEEYMKKSIVEQEYEQNDNDMPSGGDAWLDVDRAMARDMARQQDERRRQYRAEHNLPLDDDD